MSRHAVKISLEEFKMLCQKKLNVGEEFDPYELSEKIQKDLKKIEFDFENFSIGDAADETGFENYPCGFEVLDNGLPVLFVNAGGDWEFPICFCIYWDGKQFRAYIPTDGNAFNKKEKCAFGSEFVEEIPENPMQIDEMRKLIDPDAIRKDVVNRIKII
jgi:hypothetical protein